MDKFGSFNQILEEYNITTDERLCLCKEETLQEIRGKLKPLDIKRFNRLLDAAKARSKPESVITDKRFTHEEKKNEIVRSQSKSDSAINSLLVHQQATNEFVPHEYMFFIDEPVTAEEIKDQISYQLEVINIHNLYIGGHMDTLSSYGNIGQALLYKFRASKDLTLEYVRLLKVEAQKQSRVGRRKASKNVFKLQRNKQNRKVVHFSTAVVVSTKFKKDDAPSSVKDEETLRLERQQERERIYKLQNQELSRDLRSCPQCKKMISNCLRKCSECCYNLDDRYSRRDFLNHAANNISSTDRHKSLTLSTVSGPIKSTSIYTNPRRLDISEESKRPSSSLSITTRYDKYDGSNLLRDTSIGPTDIALEKLPNENLDFKKSVEFKNGHDHQRTWIESKRKDDNATIKANEKASMIKNRFKDDSYDLEKKDFLKTNGSAPTRSASSSRCSSSVTLNNNASKLNYEQRFGKMH